MPNDAGYDDVAMGRPPSWVLGSTLALTATVVACGASRTRDVVGERPRWITSDAAAPPVASNSVPTPPPAITNEPRDAVLPRVVVRASTRAIAMDATRIYFGDTREDAVFAVSKSGGEPVRIARRAPVAGSVVLDDQKLVWIGSPGNVVLRVDLTTGTTSTLREGGIFTDVAASNGEIFVAEAMGSGGVVHRIGANGNGATRIATLDALPRAIAVSDGDVFVATASKLLRLPRAGGNVQTVTTGAGFSSPLLEERFVDVVTGDTSTNGAILVRIPRDGGQPMGIDRVVRNAPITRFGTELFYVTGGKSLLSAFDTSSGRRRILADADLFADAVAMVADADTVFVAAGTGDDGLIVAVAKGAAPQASGGTHDGAPQDGGPGEPAMR